MGKFTFDFTPDPKVLIALTQTPILPMDALCELIDNSIDSFHNAILQGIKISHPTIWIFLPKKKELDNNMGVLRLRDNGPGMTTEQAESAIRAGYSGNNSIDTLGLFGMGFNISTGKLGITTKFTTARKSDDFCTRTTIDLEKISRSKSYQLEADTSDKEMILESGTLIDICNWWPEGHSNHGFIYTLVRYGASKIREEIGRRYATLLRDGEMQIVVDGTPCTAFEHCVWDSKRTVVRKGEEIPARYDIDKVIGTKRRCAKCRTIIADGETACPSCGCSEIRSVEERIKGWVGIQRFDDATRYGIDLIRNGRAIRIAEKNAFFEYVDEFRNVTKDYPIDSQYGRIVGEINLDFVPVDFLKQDFQRSSDEWQRAMSYLRGDSSLQPTQPGADSNNSVIYKLYQGYRKVRTPGTTDMYMGYWDKDEGKPKRFPNRDKEKEFYEKFQNRVPGYFDDTEWWKVVEEASSAPVDPLVTCEECGAQNLMDSEVCTVCGKVLKGKKCINPDCEEIIPISAVVCPTCGTDQVPKVESSWICKICGTMNPAGTVICKKCNHEKGKANPIEEEELIPNSLKDESMSLSDLSIQLCNKSKSNPIQVTVFHATSEIIAPLTKTRLPIIVYKKPNNLDIVVDKTHPIFRVCGASIEELVATEIAAYIFDIHRNLSSDPAHSISNIAWKIIQKYWMDKVEISLENVVKKCENLTSAIKSQIAFHIQEDKADRLFNELSENDQKLMLYEMQKNHIPLSEIPNLKQSGDFIKFAPDSFILHIFDELPELFFNGNVWTSEYGVELGLFGNNVLDDVYKHTIEKYHNCLEAIIIFMSKKSKEPSDLKRINSILETLYLETTDEIS